MINVLWLRSSLRARVVVYLLLIAAALFTLLPFVWAIINSIKTSADTFRARPR